MGRKNWDKVAREQFDAMPADYKEGWQDLRDKKYSH